MKPMVIIFRVVILIIGGIVIAFNVLLYDSFEKQKAQTFAISKQQQLEAQVTSNQFKYQQDQIERLGKDLENAQQQTKDQKDALLQEVDKRQQVENENKDIQISLVDIKAEADAIKQEMKGWQKDYVSVLAQLEKKMDESKFEIKSLEDNLTALNIPELKANINSIKADVEKMSHPSDNTLSDTLPAPEQKTDNSQSAQ